MRICAFFCARSCRRSASARSTNSSTAQSGFVELREQKPDFVLTDLSMKPVDGIEFTRKVRLGRDSPNPYLPIIMVTGHTERARVEAARDAGVTEFLAKPITTQSLLTRLIEVVERPRPFIRCESYFGPDRRRHKMEGICGPLAPARRRERRRSRDRLSLSPCRNFAQISSLFKGSPPILRRDGVIAGRARQFIRAFTCSRSAALSFSSPWCSAAS